MTLLLAAALVAQISSPTTGPRVTNWELNVPEVGTVRFGMAVPTGADDNRPRPLVLALHPGGRGDREFYGTWFMQEIVLPALSNVSGLQPIVVAPDCPAQAWSDPRAERGVMALVQHVIDEQTIDARRILVTGFSLGGQGTWFLESRHADLFTGAIVMAGRTRDEPLDALGKIPTYVIHGKNDIVAPFRPAENTARELERMGRPVTFEALDGVDHFHMGDYIDAFTRGVRWVAERWAK